MVHARALFRHPGQRGAWRRHCLAAESAVRVSASRGFRIRRILGLRRASTTEEASAVRGSEFLFSGRVSRPKIPHASARSRCRNGSTRPSSPAASARCRSADRSRPREKRALGHLWGIRQDCHFPQTCVWLTIAAQVLNAFLLPLVIGFLVALAVKALPEKLRPRGLASRLSSSPWVSMAGSQELL